MERSKHPALASVVGLVLFGVFVLVGIFVAAPPSSRVGAIAIGVASSLFATLVYAVFDGVLTGSRRVELKERLGDAQRLTSELSIVSEAERNQIEAVRPKVDYEPDDWMSILNEADHSLTMVGHALDKWCDGEKIEEAFCEAIRRVVSNGGEVRLLMLAEADGRVSKLRDKGYTKRIRRTLDVLAKVDGELKGPGLLRVCHLGEMLDMPYMAVANEKAMITATYPATSQSSNCMPALRISTDSAIARQLQTDIKALFESDVVPAKLLPLAA
jgi:hypothetical protein